MAYQQYAPQRAGVARAANAPSVGGYGAPVSANRATVGAYSGGAGVARGAVSGSYGGAANAYAGGAVSAYGGTAAGASYAGGAARGYSQAQASNVAYQSQAQQGSGQYARVGATPASQYANVQRQGGAYSGSQYAAGSPRVQGVAQPAQYAQAQYAQAASQYAQPAPSQYAAAVMPAAVQQGIVATPELLATIHNLMDNRDALKTAVIKAFKHVAGAGSDRSLDMQGLTTFRADLSKRLDIPQQVFGSIQEEFERFDFDGSGGLGANEVYKLVKWHLYEFLKSSGTQARDSIPVKTPKQAGYTMTKDLGAGSFGAVKLACDKYGNQRCIKCCKKVAMSNLSELQDEFDAMQLLACMHIAKTYEIFQDAEMIYMVNEVYLGQDLTKVEFNARSARVTMNEAWWRSIFRQSFEALSFMHQQAVMHCDVKEPNLMLRNKDFANPQIVLIDFGVSKAMAAKEDGSCSGTPGYFPPETMTTGKWHARGDVFSMGIVMMQLLTGKVPDEDKARQGIFIGIFLEGCTDLEGVKRATCTRQPPFHLMPAQYPGLTQFTRRCLEKQLSSRPTSQVALNDPWFDTGAPEAHVPIEQAMRPCNPMATVGITDEMMMATPAMTCAITFGGNK